MPNGLLKRQHILYKGTLLALENSPYFATQPLISRQNDVCGTNEEIPYWWRETTQIKIGLLIGCSKLPSRHNQSEQYQDQGSNTSSVWNFCTWSSDSISQGNQWWRCNTSAVLLSYILRVSWIRRGWHHSNSTFWRLQKEKQKGYLKSYRGLIVLLILKTRYAI